ncbi:hypothetical protein PR202_ga12576 [Eleusine coracana subsp. coracana]|uniref:Dof zinc finger protein n=2 Tax=Eleusine coracana TaxID=4511 RepID=A0AAV5CC41_ELECO|nr:hypothetical protein QOZ80_3AG0227310 [Eleusine coracana subsp. coracana]QDQ29860.1 DNA-binding with one finger protein [Eleusine coracana]GJM95798.1 hypothetical protein PR202_ga12576 [Eleusine coracana subsp. coracana]
MTAVAEGDEPPWKKGGGAGTTPPSPQQRQQQKQQPPAEQQQEGLRCPRCASANTKFCYYNNYSLSQPRHFCKACRRYWTKGGALRNVPVGGACRKNKRRLIKFNNLPAMAHDATCADQQSTASARLGFLGVPAPTTDYKLMMSTSSAAVAGTVGQYLPLVEWPSSGPSPTVADLVTCGTGNGSTATSSSSSSSMAASMIESLSFINQDLLWKLQQQRLSTMFLPTPTTSNAFLQMAAAGAPRVETTVPAVTSSWIMMNSSSYYVLPPSPPTTPPPANTAAPIVTTTTTNCNIDSGRSSDDIGIPAAWGDMSAFTMLP